MKKLLSITSGIVFGLLLTCSANGQKIRAVPDPDSAHILKLVKMDRKLPSKIETDGEGNSTLIVSPAKGFKAYVLCVPPETSETENCSARVFIENTKTSEVYEVRGEELFAEVGRPVDALKWQNATTLSYERWMQPHFGHRYIIDVGTLKQTAAYILSDR